ncbi:MAG: type 1 glutamine amidotransferase domain-containing protein [Polyangiaceae bacterium]
MARVLVPVPDHDFDTTEVSVPWRLLTDAGHEVVFATEGGGSAPACDPLLLTGVVFGQLGAEAEPKAFYADMITTAAFRNPVAWSGLASSSFDALLLPGGHAPGMKQYLASEGLHALVADLWVRQVPVAAICHGVLVLARARTNDGASVLAAASTTCLPKYMERAAYFSTFWKVGRYYRTYPAYVEDEVKAALRDPSSQFRRGPRVLRAKGTRTDDSDTFVVEDGRYVSARWPGDAYAFARAFLAKLPPGARG